MTDPSPKRRRKVTTFLEDRLDHLPPELIVHEILTYVQIFSPDHLWERESPAAMRYMGRFTRDPMRTPYLLQTNMVLSTYDILGAVAASAQAAVEAMDDGLLGTEMDDRTKQAISKFLPAMFHGEIKRYTAKMCDVCNFPNDRLSDCLCEYRATFKELERFIRGGCIVNPTWKMQLGHINEAFPNGWPDIDRQEFMKHIRLVVGVLFHPLMQQLEAVGGELWLLKTLTGAQEHFTNTFNTIDFTDAITISFNDVEKMQNATVTKLIRAPIVWGPTPNMERGIFRLVALYPQLTHLDLVGATLPRANPLGRSFTELLGSRPPFKVLNLPYSFPIDPKFMGWTKTVIHSLAITNRGQAVTAPEISDTLRVLNLEAFKIPTTYTLPKTVTFLGCAFISEELPIIDKVVLLGPVKRATFSHRCKFPTDTPHIHSATIEKLIWNGFVMRLPSLTLDMPSLKRVELSMPPSTKVVTIITDDVIDSLTIRSWSNNTEYDLRQGVKALTLIKGFPRLKGALQFVNELHLIQPPPLSALRGRTDYDGMVNILELHVKRDKEGEVEGRGRAGEKGFQIVFGADMVVIEQ